MSYTTHPLKCEQCGAQLEVEMEAETGYGRGGHKATCPKCGKAQGSFPNRIIRVYEVQES